MIKHYMKQIISQILKIFGQFDVIGNPISLIGGLGVDVFSMFYDPISALMKGKGSLKIGKKFTKGIAKLIISTITNIIIYLFKIANIIMNICANLTYHKQYIYERQNRQNRQVKNFCDGLNIGIHNFFSILWEAVSGIVMRPIRQTIDSGVFFGLFVGIWQGVVGFIIKPTVGIYDMIYVFGLGIVNSQKYEENVMNIRSRPPRIFNSKNLI